MERLDGGSAVPSRLAGGIVALGNFDGFHLGHQAVVGRAVARARAVGRPALVGTFDPHPVRLFRPNAAPFRLTSLDQRERLFAEAGADAMVVFGFDAAMAALTADAFVAERLVRNLRVGGVVTGEDFTFGKGKAGNARVLAELGAAHGFAAETVGPVALDGEAVSSSRIRDALRTGDTATAERLLTRPFAIQGKVQHGDKVGRTIGYPTANIDLGTYLRPAYGIYAVTGRLDDGTVLRGAANLGIRPTFDPPKELLEPYFFDFAGDLYGRTIEVALVEYLRAEAKFDGLDALVAQMDADCARARAVSKRAGRMTEATDYRDTVFLPKTEFPMKAGLAAKEPAILERWARLGVYDRLREQRAGRERFILHDGPPYANGDIHMGHAMNKVLKDIIVRSQSLMGKDAPYVPGWDCHGLPIEWKVEEAYRAKKLNKDEVPVQQFRAECRAYAEKWVEVQRAQFERLGVMGDWADPYLTMNYAAEATIVGELLKFADAGQLYRGAKPVMWSPVEKTALAEAEIEYEDVVSTQIDVAFEIVEAPDAPELVGAFAVIWTTTPWTIPVNQALAYGEGIDYVLLDVAGRRLLIAEALVHSFSARHDRHPGDGVAEGATILWRGKGADLHGATARHPIHHLGGFFATPRPFLAGDFVTTEAGTGLVHMAPDHGEDDFLLCKAHGIEPVFAVDAAGMYRADWAWLGGQGSVINKKFVAADGPICADLRAAGALVAASDDFAHSYPHSWRSKAKVIFRATPQWFIPMDQAERVALPSAVPEIGTELVGVGFMPGYALSNGPTLRETALDAIERTRWVPARSQNRIRSMVEGRPDWVISRQRAWGVPIALYVERKTGQYLSDEDVNARIVAAFRAGGADAWFGADHQALLGDNYALADYEVVQDILDVWFDSGCTHVFTVEARYGEGVRANLYLEGSDQHRGWFQSSLLESSGTRGRAPYEAVLTHGFALDGQGRKMSKSLGNVVDPLKIIQESGADILRMWVASTDYFDDVKIGKEVLGTASDAYRKLRNTFRYLLGALDGFDEGERVAVAEMPELERYVLHLLGTLDADLREAADAYEFNRYLRLLTDFANEDLSAFFFDVRKDCLYCDAPGDAKRRAYRTVLDTLFHALVRYAAPILCFTAEEVWQARFPSEDGSVHYLEWPELPAMPGDGAVGTNWADVRALRVRVTEAIEPLRREKTVRSSLEAEVTVPTLPLDAAALAEVFIVARVDEGADAAVAVTRTAYQKCGRCWRHLPEVTTDGTLCDRCTGVVAQ